MFESTLEHKCDSRAWSEGDSPLRRALVRSGSINNPCHWGSGLRPAECGAVTCHGNMLSFAAVSTTYSSWYANTKWEVKGEVTTDCARTKAEPAHNDEWSQHQTQMMDAQLKAGDSRTQDSRCAQHVLMISDHHFSWESSVTCTRLKAWEFLW